MLIGNHFKKKLQPEETIKRWFTSWPNANVGIVTGAVSDVVVVDLDSDEAKEKIKSLLPNYELSTVPRVRTGRGGYHSFFKHPGGNVQTKAGILPKTDVRADGGYVVTAPSIHESGQKYTWEVPISGELPKLPLLDAARQGNCHIAMLHHAGKYSVDDLDAAIGSTAIRGLCYTYLFLKRLNSKSERRIYQ